MVKATLRSAVLLGLLAWSVPSFAEVQNVKVGGDVNVRGFLRKSLRLSEDIFNGTGFLEEVSISNTTAAELTVSIKDKQGTPVSILVDSPVPENGLANFSFNKRYCPGGLQWKASATGLVGTARYRQ